MSNHPETQPDLLERTAEATLWRRVELMQLTWPLPPAIPAATLILKDAQYVAGRIMQVDAGNVVEPLIVAGEAANITEEFVERDMFTNVPTGEVFSYARFAQMAYSFGWHLMEKDLARAAEAEREMARALADQSKQTAAREELDAAVRVALNPAPEDTSDPELGERRDSAS